jgi:hypothetical protein
MGTVMHVSLIDSSRTGLQMMKFSLNHSDRIKSPKVNFLIGLQKFSIVFLMELCNGFYMLTLTQYQSIIYAYIKMYSIASLDKLTFLMLEAGDPFAHMIDATADHQPRLMTFQRTTSNKNAWAYSYYDENIFGGKIPDNWDVPLEIEIDKRLFTEAGYARYQMRKQEKESVIPKVNSNVNESFLNEIEEEVQVEHTCNTHNPGL